MVAGGRYFGRRDDGVPFLGGRLVVCEAWEPGFDLGSFVICALMVGGPLGRAPIARNTTSRTLIDIQKANFIHITNRKFRYMGCMDIELARTFLAVVDTGSFLAASERVHVTQSTVSARIRLLEQQLGRPVFVRDKSGARLTTAGRHFQRHAQALVRTWAQAKLDAGLPDRFDVSLEIGAQYSLWDGFLLPAIKPLRETMPRSAIKISIGFSDTLMQKLVEGQLDLAVVYAPPRTPGLIVQQLLEDEFVLVSSNPDETVDPLGDDYVFVDWGPEFRADHLLNFPDLELPAVQIGVGTLGLQLLWSQNAAGYFPRRIVEGLADRQRLRMIDDAPRFAYAAYAVFDQAAQDDAAGQAADLLCRFARDRCDASA